MEFNAEMSMTPNCWTLVVSPRWRLTGWQPPFSQSFEVLLSSNTIHEVRVCILHWLACCHRIICGQFVQVVVNWGFSLQHCDTWMYSPLILMSQFHDLAWLPPNRGDCSFTRTNSLSSLYNYACIFFYIKVPLTLHLWKSYSHWTQPAWTCYCL